VNFLLDHDVPENVARVLEREKHRVLRVAQILLRTAADPEVFAQAKTQGLVLVTCNRDDFIPLAKEWPHAGIIILIRRQSRAKECQKILELLQRAGEQGLANNINFA